MTDKRITFTKGDAKKFLDENSKLIPVILKDGWQEQKEASKPKSKPTKKKED